MAEMIVIVGAGVFGAWTAEHLRAAGHRVVLIDAYGPANALASSGGESRLIRAAYGKDEIYTRMARDSLPWWQELSAQSGLPIFAPHGILFFFARDESYFLDTVETHRRLGLSTEILDKPKLVARFPMFDFEGILLGLLEPQFGALMARRAVLTLVDRFVRAGGEYRQAKVMPPLASGTSLNELFLSSGDRITADRFVFAAGPWLPDLFPEVIGKRIRRTRQEVFFFAPPAGDCRFGPAAMPGWADFNGGDMFYGFPDLESRGVKLAHDVHGPEIDPDSQDRRPTASVLETVIAYRDRRFPALRGAPMTESRVCQYENSSNGDFLIDFHPQWNNVLLVGGGSGHGFKHGPEVGHYAASLLAGDGVAEARFSLASKSETHAREIH
ncbi:MAG TPA: FAD-dependent oxidoreductase [Sphingomicrobium sp.]|nr:FAD-dependent oxidoreductase [Sphingomicrobium sp.]